MSKRIEADPTRWQDLPPPGAQQLTIDPEIDSTIGEISRAARMVTGEPPAEDLRLAHIRQRVLAHFDPGVSSESRLVRPWLRMAALVLASLCAGGVAVAVTGRLIERRQRAAAAAGQPARVGGGAETASPHRRSARRWRVAVNVPTELDLSVGPDGTDLTVVAGGVQIAGVDTSTDVTLSPGFSWRGTAAPADGPPGSAPVAPAVPPGTAPPLSLVLSPSVPARPAGPGAVTARPSGGGVAVDPVGPGARDRLAEGAAIGARTRDGLSKNGARIASRGRASLSARDVAAGGVESVRVDAGAARSPAGNESAQITVPLPRVALSEPAPSLDGGRFPAPSRPSSPSAPASSAGPPPPSEAALLGRAMRLLRAERDPKRALDQLDERDRRYPRGALGREAALARVEALLAMERKTTALGVLDSLELRAGAVDRRALLARAELRAAGDRDAGALADFDAVLGGGRADELAARALYGRATLRARAGDAAPAREDLEEYLRRFADGPRRREAESMLRRLTE